MTPIKWTKEYSGEMTTIDGFRVSRSNLQSGAKFYYVHWIENPHYAASHSRMSTNFRSLTAARNFIKRLQAEPMRYFEPERANKVTANMKRLDKTFASNEDKWRRAYQLYTRQFRKHDQSFQSVRGA